MKTEVRSAARVLALLAGALVPLPAWPAEPVCRGGLTSADIADIRAVLEAYRTAWLKGDKDGVLNTFTSDAVLLPAHGAKPVVGKDAITTYWWPAGAPPSTITRLDLTVEGLDGDCAVAYSHGRDDVEWTQSEDGTVKAYGHPGTYLNVYVKQPDGRWRMERHMWDDGPARGPRAN